jgi:CRISPR-associated exonuclease Cas4
VEAYLQISFLNDFIFCPRSIYFHQLYGRLSQKMYHQTPQTKGLAAHKTVDNQSYSSASNILQGMEVYSHRYNIAGKIDIFDRKKGLLSERKKKIKVVYDGFIYQLYAQYFSLVDMGFEVKALRLYSMEDNKTYPIEKPENDLPRLAEFEKLLLNIRSFDMEDDFVPNPNKCAHCIYINVCDVVEGESC